MLLKQNNVFIKMLFVIAITAFGIGSVCLAQAVPQKISFQGKLLENGQPVNGIKNFVFTLMGTGWSENQSNVQVTDGLYSVQLGSVNPIPSSVFDDNSSLTLEISVEGTVLSPPTEILAVPYAFKAEKANDTNKIGGNPVSGTPQEDQILKWVGGAWVPATSAAENDGYSLNSADGSLTDAVYVSGNGNFGIGTTTPQNKLDLSIAPDSSDGIFFGKAGSSSSGTLLQVAGTNNQMFTIDIDPNNGTLYEQFQIKYDGNNTVFSIDDTGNVGIGTSTPQSKLDVAGNIEADSITVKGVPVGASSDSYWSDNSGNIYYNGGNVGIGTSTPASNLHVYVPGSSSPVSALTVDVKTFVTASNAESSYYLRMRDIGGGAEAFAVRGDGKIGIGTSSPELKLQIVDIAQDLDGGAVLIGPTFSPHIRIGHNTEQLWIQTHGSKPLLINPLLNNVGIGTATPGAKLDVAGDVKATAFYYTSDKKLKDNIQDIPDSLEKIKKLRGVSFEWKDSGKKSLGLIAQELEEVFPELVETNNSTDLKSVQYGNLVAPLIEAVKTQQAQIEAQEQRIKSLENEISKLKLLITGGTEDEI